MKVKIEKVSSLEFFVFLTQVNEDISTVFLKAPKWYENNPDVDSRCWFTEEGYRKYHKIIDDLISELQNTEIRLLKAESLENLVVQGKIQCIQRIE